MTVSDRQRPRVAERCSTRCSTKSASDDRSTAGAAAAQARPLTSPTPTLSAAIPPRLPAAAVGPTFEVGGLRIREGRPAARGAFSLIASATYESAAGARMAPRTHAALPTPASLARTIRSASSSLSSDTVRRMAGGILPCSRFTSIRRHWLPVWLQVGVHGDALLQTRRRHVIAAHLVVRRGADHRLTMLVRPCVAVLRCGTPGGQHTACKCPLGKSRGCSSAAPVPPAGSLVMTTARPLRALRGWPVVSSFWVTFPDESKGPRKCSLDPLGSCGRTARQLKADPSPVPRPRAWSGVPRLRREPIGTAARIGDRLGQAA